MSVIWCGGEDIDFPNGNAPVIDTSAVRSRSGYARCGIGPSTGSSNICKSVTFGAITSCWLSCRTYFAAISTGNFGIVGLAKSGSNSGLFLGNQSASTGRATLYKRDSGTLTQLAAEAGNSLTGGGLHRLEMQLSNYSSSATVNVYIDGVLVISFTGDVTVTGVSNLDQIWLTGNVQLAVIGSEFIVTDEDPRAWPGLVTMAPNALGTTDAWSNTAFTNVNPTTINDANATFINTTAQDEEYSLIAIPSGVFNVKAVKIAARAMSTAGATAANLKLGFNQGGTVAVNPQHATTTAFATYEDLFATNPVSGSAWAQSDLTGLQVDMRSA